MFVKSIMFYRHKEHAKRSSRKRITVTECNYNTNLCVCKRVPDTLTVRLNVQQFCDANR